MELRDTSVHKSPRKYIEHPPPSLPQIHTQGEKKKMIIIKRNTYDGVLGFLAGAGAFSEDLVVALFVHSTLANYSSPTGR